MPLELALELASLQRQQRDALEYAIYMGMSPQDEQEYERRASRITELKRMLGIKLEVSTNVP